MSAELAVDETVLLIGTCAAGAKVSYHVAFVKLVLAAAAVDAGEIVDCAAIGKMVFVIVVAHFFGFGSARVLLACEFDSFDLSLPFGIDLLVYSSHRVSAAWALSY